MDELKLIFASNLIRLRTAAGMTQAELGEQLNYSDKSVSFTSFDSPAGRAVCLVPVNTRIAYLQSRDCASYKTEPGRRTWIPPVLRPERHALQIIERLSFQCFARI